MLERFKVPKEDEVRVPAAALRSTVEALFVKMGVPDEDAQEGANTLVMTDLRAVETHGVSNMLRSYISSYQQGSLNPRPNWRVIQDSPSGAAVDADRGLGVIVAPKVMRMAISKARETGVGAVSMHNSGHTGAVGHHSMLAAEADMIGICMTAGWPAIPPTFGAEPRFGTNPISLAAPASKEPFFLFDAATSTIAGNKVRWHSVSRPICCRDGSPGRTAFPRRRQPLRRTWESIFFCRLAEPGSTARTRGTASQ